MLHQRLSELHELSTLEDREIRLYKMAKAFGWPTDVLGARDMNAGIDLFLIEFPNQEIAADAGLNMGLSLIRDSNLAYLTMPSGKLH